ncbi:MAG: hypothetical protein CMP49_03195 [Flavobacteriales bacterium]|nr:hypothetical protein [Flavobacteriales bacterium]|tara:strand:+ start:25130 stop:26131 length:1002 start_codon:yes stop_codon:yes gene_type:complete
MYKILLFSLIPFIIFCQDNYVKNEHVEISTIISNNDYIIDYQFKDHFNKLHSLQLFFKKEETDLMINRFGFPTSLLKKNKNSKNVNTDEKKEIIEQGLFLIDGGIIKKNKKSIVDFYKRSVTPIAQYIINYLKFNKIDNRENRIEMAMKFVQDIPYAIPKESRRIYKNGYITPPEVLIEGYGDCDSKTILFVCIMSFLIPEDDIVFVSIPGHIFSAIKYYDNNYIEYNSNEYIPFTQRKDDNLTDRTYIKYKNSNYFICETAGPGRPNYGHSNQEIKMYKIEEIDLNGILTINGDCFHSENMHLSKDGKRFLFEHNSCYIFNPPSSYDLTKPE